MKKTKKMIFNKLLKGKGLSAIAQEFKGHIDDL